jgi:hypothetical protein
LVKLRDNFAFDITIIIIIVVVVVVNVHRFADVGYSREALC